MEVIDVRPLSIEQWLQVVEPEYLSEYVPQGGAGAKFVIGDEPALDRLQRMAGELARRHNMQAAQASAGSTKLHMLQELVFAIARALPWDALLQRYIETLFTRNGYPWPQPGAPLTMPALAQHFDVAPNLLARNRDQWLSRDLWEDASMAQDFRGGLLRLCVARLEPDGSEPELAVLGWLRGEKIGLSQLRQYDIAARISRTNARAILVSLCHFLRKAGSAGLLLTLDLRPALPPTPAAGDLRYSPGALMDLYEVLREIIDDLEHLPGLFLLVLADQALAAGDRRRTLDTYKALEMRIWPDVRPGDQQNPLAPLVTVHA